jgi:hypothetical protein
MNLLIAGSRAFKDYNLLIAEIDKFIASHFKDQEIIIISGGAVGADQMGERYAASKGYKCQRFPADWKKYGKAAGPIRNKQMVDISDAAAIFWNKVSPGTRNTLNLCKDKQIPLLLVEYTELVV